MTAYLLLTACAAGANPPWLASPPGWPAYPVPAQVVGYQMAPTVPMLAPAPMLAPSVPLMMPQPGTAIMPVAHGCASGNCGPAGCDTCDDGKRLFQRCRKNRCHDRDLPCGHPDYQAAAHQCGCGTQCSCGLLNRLRNCFHKRRGCEDTCCKKPGLRDRLKKCFQKNDCCEDKPTCCKPKAACTDCGKPSLRERLRACFQRCRKNDCCGSTAMAPAAGQPEPIKPPKEMPKDKEKEGVRAPLPKGPPLQVISETPF